MVASDDAPLILIVDDEPDLVAALEYNLRREGYRTRNAANGKAAIAAANLAPRPDLVLLDLMLPDMSGTEICRSLRAEVATASIAIIMITAKGEELDRVVGFEAGADDYVVKPFNGRELALRIAALLRRSRPSGERTTDVADTGDVADSGHPAATRHTATIDHDFGVLQVDISGHRVRVAGTDVRLTALEFRLLCTLLERAGRVQSRDTLLIDVWGYAPDVTTRTVDTHVKRLRAKLGVGGEVIETVRGVGYCVRSATAPQSPLDAGPDASLADARPQGPPRR